jgi:hypothetical protein
VSRNNLIAVILILFAALLFLVVMINIPPENSVACTFPPAGRASCISDMSDLKVVHFEDGSIRITGCIHGELCED